MTLDQGNERCVRCSKSSISSVKCFGCQQAFCTKHFMKHRSNLAEQLNEVNQKQEFLQQELNRNAFDYPLLSSIYAWERKSMRKIQEIAEKARDDLQKWTERTKDEVKNSLDQLSKQLRFNEKTNNFTELDLEKWTKQLEELQKLLEKPTTISIIEDENPSSHIHTIKVLDEPPSSPSSIVVETTKSFAEKSTNSVQEHFVKMYGPCELSEEDQVVTHVSYRAGLSQISGYHHYSIGKHAIDVLVEKKGVKNLFIGIVSSSDQIISPTFDYSVHGWWNFEHMIINGESKGGDTKESIESGDKITLIIDCDNRQIELAHYRTGKLIQLPVKLEVCPFPWKILIRLLTTGDSIRILC